MRVFHCDRCDQLIFFESFACVSCGRRLAYLPDLGQVGSLEPAGMAPEGGADGLWRSPLPAAQGQTYRLCENYSARNVCNWAIPPRDPGTLCVSCRLTRMIPDLSRDGNQAAWYKIELAKRRLVYTLLELGLPLASKAADPERGLSFEFLADPDDPQAPPVLTGHAHGTITINVAEADDAERERRRQALHEPYRTLLGHFRHEVGHYYWDRLIASSESRLREFRDLFGDERTDYRQALERHYRQGAPGDWQQRFVTAYASAHPWEDWAETWAHYVHMVDTLETATACGLSLRPHRADEPALETDPHRGPPAAFARMVEDWFPLTYVLNNLNRGLGLPDAYPFVLSPAVVEKLRFVHETVAAASGVPEADEPSEPDADDEAREAEAPGGDRSGLPAAERK